MSKFNLVLAHAPFIGHTGYARHAQSFFTALDNYIPVRVRNFTHCNELDHLTQKQKDMIIHQTWTHIPWEVGRPFVTSAKDKLLNIILMETNHFYFYENYKGPKIAFNVFESTRQPEQFFSRLLQYDQLWVPTTWQRDCSIEQGYPEDKVFVVPEGVNGFTFYPLKTNKKRNGKFRFLIFGRWDYRKYTMEMVKAFVEVFGNHEDIELHISADNPYPVDTMNSTEERFKYYGFDKYKNIKILHFPDREEYIKYLREGHVLLSSSRSEGWNLPCVLPNTLVVATNGITEIEKIKKSEKVVTHTGKHKKVIEVMNRKYSGKICSINLYGDCDRIDLTPEHPVFCIKKSELKRKRIYSDVDNIEPKWVEAKNIEKGDVVLRSTPQQIYEGGEIIDLVNIDKTLKYNNEYVWYNTGYNSRGEKKIYNRFISLDELSYFLGWYIPEGSSAGSRVGIYLNKTEIDIAVRCINDIKRLFGIEGYYKIKGNNLNVRFDSVLLCKLFSSLCGNGSHHKKIPMEILYGPIERLKTLVYNMVQGDGHINLKNGNLNYYTVSKILARQCMIAFQILGWKPRIQIDKRCEGKSISFSPKNIVNGYHSNKSWHHKYGLAILVKDVSSYDYNGLVYNLEVEDDNSYLLTNASVHNCIEALACGTPSITINWGAHLDFCKPDAGTIFVDVKEFKKPENVFMQTDVPGLWAEPDFEDLKLKIKDAYENYDMYKKRAVEGSDWVREEFSWSNAAKKAFDIISEIDVLKYYPVKLNLGSGEFYKDGYVNIDKYHPTADEKHDAKELPYSNESVQEIYSSHLLEHFNKFEIETVLKEWFRVLKFGGELILEIPDFEWCVKNWLDSKEKWGFPLDTIFGLQDKPGEEHKCGFTKEKILELLDNIGYTNIILQDAWSHEQQCFKITAKKEKIEYNDDIFVIDTYPNAPEKEKILLETIERVSKIGKPIALVSHLMLPPSLLEKVNYFIYDSNNRKSHDYSLTLWHTVPKKVKVITHLDNTYHGLSCLSSIKNAVSFLSSKYNFIHFIEYDMNADFEKYLELVNEKRKKNKKFIGFDYHHDTPKQDGIITNLFSTDPKWLNEKLEEYSDWDHFYKRASEIANNIGKIPDMILEHWMWNYFLYKDMMKDSHIFPQDMEESIVVCGNMMDQLEEEPEVKVKLSETIDSRIGVFFMRDRRSKEGGKYTIVYTKPFSEVAEEIEGYVSPGDVTYHFFPKEGTIEVIWGRNSRKIFEIDPNKKYDEAVFRFYDDSVKCIAWNPQDDEGFMWQSGDRDTIEFSFIDKPKIEILGNSEELYQLKFIDGDTNITRFENSITPNHWSACNFNYFINWRNEVYLNDKLVASHNFDPTGKRVKVKLDSKAIGDTIAWFPYIEEFRKKYDCDMYAGTFHNYLFKENYPEIHFIDPDQSVENLYASYNVGARDNDYESNKNNWRVVPLQQVSSDYLGLEYKEIRPKIVVPNKKRPIDKKYVTITEHSTIQCKYWLYRNGWQTLVDYLISKGYIVVVVSKEQTNLKNVVKYINRPMEDTINTIRHSDFFIGISTGPTWLAWALEVPTVLISGYSALWGEMKDCIRIGAAEGKCSGCFNDKDLFFDRGNWNWCPKSKNMECTTSITSKEVIDRIQPLIK